MTITANEKELPKMEYVRFGNTGLRVGIYICTLWSCQHIECILFLRSLVLLSVACRTVLLNGNLG